MSMKDLEREDDEIITSFMSKIKKRRFSDMS